MVFVEVLDGYNHPSPHRSRVNQVYRADVVTLERIDDVLGHPADLSAVNGRVDQLRSQLPCRSKRRRST
jgi:hypothetical protein